MMSIIFLLLAFLASTCVVTQRGKQKTVIIMTKTTPYCGGANPSEEILNESRKKKIPVGEKFYIINGIQNTDNRKIVDTLVVDSTGKILILLKPGTYSIISDFGYKKVQADTSQYDINCLNALWEIPLFSIKVTKGKIDTFSHNIEEPCPYDRPCYTGKMGLPM